MLKELFFGVSSIKGPIWLKAFSAYNKQLEDLKEISCNISEDKKKIIDRDILYLEQGIEGEKRVSYEIENSFIPMLALYDVRIEDGSSAAQMDYVLITKYFILVLETKKLNGDITINESSEFIRYFKNSAGKVYKKEGMYSPVAQNERHIRILDDYLKKNKIIKNVPIYSCIVLSNPKNVINKSKAPDNLKNQIIKCDQLATFIKDKLEKNKKLNNGKMLDRQMYSIGNFLLENNKPMNYDVYKKYSDYIINDSKYLNKENESDNKENLLSSLKDESSYKVFEKEVSVEEKITEIEKNELESVNKSENQIIKELKELRLNFAKDEKVPAYYIFNDETLNDIICKMPKSKDELLKVKGFGKVKVGKYGDKIIEVLN